MTVKQAGQLLLKHKIDSAPVVDKAAPQRVTGKITKNRIFQHFIEQA
jgi:CBS domain.